MYPNNAPQQPPQPGQQPDLPVDYLNQISGNYTPKQSGPSTIVMLVAGGLGIIAIIFFVITLMSSGPSAQNEATDVYVRLKTLESVSGDYQKKLRDNDLRSINSGLTLQLNNAINSLEEPLAAIEVDTGAIPKTVQAAEKSYKADIENEFDDAILNVQLDNVYAREISFQLATLRAMMVSTYKASSSASFKQSLEEVDAQLQPFVEKFADFTSD